ncbi:hypothetical protein G4Y79_09075 [Phototrophicus methaneseepsis]|uniref:Polymer-forming cytoskeletal protein n=1 Tax=Phototrophicus methaneseepsis TaxID=2710758 RepID=A0A7S8IGE1_9CHLR|nr:hypothetical protein [Phototrophicus methaneseepsis]QPC84509.1 hypothetical protein G4Y79_09075 [Phototrophicus methaneseepsis]
MKEPAIRSRTPFYKLRRLIWVCGLVLILWVWPAQAREVLQGRACNVDADDTVVGNLFAMCENLTIDGTVRGNIFGMAIHADINGTVEGSIYLASTDLNIQGNILGDVHFGGVALNWRTPLETTSMQPAEDRDEISIRTSNLLALGLSVTIDEDAILPGSIVNLGYQLIVNGAVRDEINFWGSTLQIGGPVMGDVYATVGDPLSSNSSVETILLPFNFDVTLADPGLTITDDGRVAGSLEYYAPAPGRINGSIDGTEKYVAPAPVALPTFEEPATIANYLRSAFQEGTSLFVVGVAAVLLAAGSLNAPLYRIRRRPFASLSVGLLTFIISFPVVLIFILLSLLLVIFLLLVNLDALAVLMTFVLSVVNIGGATVFYLTAIFVARALFALAIGRSLARIFWARNGLHVNPYAALLMGVVILALLVTLPFVGWIINAVSLFLGLGGILTVILERIQRVRGGEPEPEIRQYPVSSAITRRHPQPGTEPKDEPRPEPRPNLIGPFADPTPASASIENEPVEPFYNLPGMANLPEGFDIRFFEEDDA